MCSAARPLGVRAGRKLRAHAALAEEIARASLTLAWDDGFLPLAPSTRMALVDVESRAASPVEDRPDHGESAVASALRHQFPQLEVAACSPRNVGPDLATDAAIQVGLKLIATADDALNPAD